MDDPLRVGRIQSVGNLDSQLQQLHSNEMLAFMLVDVVDGADVGMIQGRGGMSLPLESFQGVGIFR
jgi:hypothetical protein